MPADCENAAYVETFGTLRFWINGIDICSYRYEGEAFQYEWELYYIVEWLCEHREYVFGYDPFPLPVKGDNTLKKLANAYEFESDDELEDDLWFTALNRWVMNHSWFGNRDGSALSCIYFNRTEKSVELIWNNDFWKKDGVIFTPAKGFADVSLEMFKSTMLNFLWEIISDMEKRIDLDCFKHWKYWIFFEKK